MKVVLDTSFFTNPDSYKYWGQGVSEAIVNFVDLANRQKEDTFYLTPSALEEIKSFFDDQPHQVLSLLEASVSVRSPFIEKITIPARFFYQLVLEIRQRSYKGLRLTEAILRQQPKDIDAAIRRLRKQYRTALRGGFLDSQTDLDLLFLAYQLPASLVTADEGLKSWAEKFGIPQLSSAGLKKRLEKR